MASKKKPFAVKAADLVETGYRNFIFQKGNELLFGEWNGLHYRVFVNEEKQTIAVVSELGERAVVKPSEGDKFDVYTGVIMALYKLVIGVSSRKVRELVAAVVPDGDTDAIAERLIMLVTEGACGICKDDVMALYKDTKEAAKGGNPHFDLVIKLGTNRTEDVACMLIRTVADSGVIRKEEIEL